MLPCVLVVSLALPHLCKWTLYEVLLEVSNLTVLSHALILMESCCALHSISTWHSAKASVMVLTVSFRFMLRGKQLAEFPDVGVGVPRMKGFVF